MQKVLFVIPKEMMENGIYSNYIKIMQKMNYEVQIITDFKQEIKINFQRYLINISNNLFSLTNFIAYKKIKRIIKNNNFEIIICYGQIYGILSRLVKDTKTQIIYIVDEFSSNKLICKIEKWEEAYEEKSNRDCVCSRSSGGSRRGSGMALPWKQYKRGR